jgi:hypothetical protein
MQFILSQSARECWPDLLGSNGERRGDSERGLWFVSVKAEHWGFGSFAGVFCLRVLTDAR